MTLWLWACRCLLCSAIILCERSLLFIFCCCPICLQYFFVVVAFNRFRSSRFVYNLNICKIVQYTHQYHLHTFTNTKTHTITNTQIVCLRQIYMIARHYLLISRVLLSCFFVWVTLLLRRLQIVRLLAVCIYDVLEWFQFFFSLLFIANMRCRHTIIRTHRFFFFYFILSFERKM